MTGMKVKKWYELSSEVQKKLAQIYMLNGAGNLNAESPALQNAIAVIYQLGTR